eukprot:COSAG02_NODE_3612_length_6484_cov_22.155834_1_plen_104_part_00
MVLVKHVSSFLLRHRSELHSILRIRLHLLIEVPRHGRQIGQSLAIFDAGREIGQSLAIFDARGSLLQFRIRIRIRISSKSQGIPVTHRRIRREVPKRGKNLMT